MISVITDDGPGGEPEKCRDQIRAERFALSCFCWSNQRNFMAYTQLRETAEVPGLKDLYPADDAFKELGEIVSTSHAAWLHTPIDIDTLLFPSSKTISTFIELSKAGRLVLSEANRLYRESKQAILVYDDKNPDHRIGYHLASSQVNFQMQIPLGLLYELPKIAFESRDNFVATETAYWGQELSAARELLSTIEKGDFDSSNLHKPHLVGMAMRLAIIAAARIATSKDIAEREMHF